MVWCRLVSSILWLAPNEVIVQACFAPPYLTCSRTKSLSLHRGHLPDRPLLFRTTGYYKYRFWSSLTFFARPWRDTGSGTLLQTLLMAVSFFVFKFFNLTLLYLYICFSVMKLQIAINLCCHGNPWDQSQYSVEAGELFSNISTSANPNQVSAFRRSVSIGTASARFQ